jgi:hypothetical protein
MATTTQKKKPKRKVKVKVKPPPKLSPIRRPRADLDIENIKLQGKHVSAKLKQAITDGSIESTIDGASTLTLVVADWYEGLLHSKLITGACTLTFDGESFTLVKIARAQGDSMTLTFEDTAVNLLRQYKGPLKANRKNTTRAQFVRKMVKEVKQARIPFKCPEVNKKQPIAGTKSAKVATTRPARDSRGLLG